ncbi:hypothetical protein [Mucilaginibacter myungsuensis]|uniref:Uncharacterized protein n=1 Tax=Mucilaginibacter myungsuensis TaxID=649104 RepID=A0A929PVG1_9SPHI|nr:hypothetical protein [Mucilaginibacter myungsuensis]MBE9661099.1 hypothetical protein [Mucilaginibacter myungsuensis]MDN3597243.1 hypothetical protein [Mucilaginibacter myungsuensis]
MAKLVLEFDLEPSLLDSIRNKARAKKESLLEYTEKLYRRDIDQIAPMNNSEADEKNEVLPQWIKDLTMTKTPTSDFDAKELYGDHIMKKNGL